MNDPASSAVTEKTPKWLKRIQENSWEAEILISGGAIFTLFQLSSFLVDAKIFLSENLPVKGLDQTIIFSMITVKGVTFSFILHLFLRGFWTAMVCVNSAFPGGIAKSKFNLAGKYTIHEKTLTSTISLLDKSCGLIFYSAFAFAMAVAGAIIVFTFIGLTSTISWWLGLFFAAMLVLFLIDLLSSGLLRKNETIGKIYYPVYIFFNGLSLIVFYRRSMQIVFSNANRVSVTAFILVFICSSLLMSYFSLYKVLNLADPFSARAFPAIVKSNDLIAYDKLYLDNIAEEENIRWFAIQSEVVTTDYLKIFVTYRDDYRDGISERNEESFYKIVSVTLNDSLVKNLQWTEYFRSKAEQLGIVAMVPVHDLPKGRNTIQILVADEYFTKRKIEHLKIPFWVE